MKSEGILKNYSLILKILLSCFLFGVLSFGRSFSILHIDIAGIPLFITEMMLFISLPFIIINCRDLLKLPKSLLVSLTLFFLYGSFYLLRGICSANLYALRDIVLCGYLLFLPLIFILFTQGTKLKIPLMVIISANVLAIIIGGFITFNTHPSGAIEMFLTKTKSFNLGFTYAIATSFLFLFYDLKKNDLFDIFIILILSLNYCMLVFLGARTIWLAFMVQMVFLLIILKKRFLKTFFVSIVPFIVIFTILYCMDFEPLKENQKMEIIFSKAKSFILFVNKSISLRRFYSLESMYPSHRTDASVKAEENTMSTPDESDGLGYDVKTNLDSISWRLGIWEQAIKFGSRSILFGNGFGVYPVYSIWGSIPVRHKGYGVDSGLIPAHNHFVTIFYKMGLLGLGLFLFTNLYIFVYGLKYIRICRSGFIKNYLIALLATFVFWHFIAFFFDVIESPPTSIFLWIILGAVLAGIEIDKKEARA